MEICDGCKGPIDGTARMVKDHRLCGRCYASLLEKAKARQTAGKGASPTSEITLMEAPSPQKACMNCGRVIGRLEKPHIYENNVVCADCSERIQASQRLDGNGTLNSTDPSAVSDKAALVAFTLGVFFGALGIHRLYAGRIVSGILMLISPLTIIGAPIAFIVAVVDLFDIANGRFRDGNGRLIRRCPANWVAANQVA